MATPPPHQSLHQSVFLEVNLTINRRQQLTAAFARRKKGYNHHCNWTTPVVVRCVSNQQEKRLQEPDSKSMRGQPNFSRASSMKNIYTLSNEKCVVNKINHKIRSWRCECQILYLIGQLSWAELFFFLSVVTTEPRNEKPRASALGAPLLGSSLRIASSPLPITF